MSSGEIGRLVRQIPTQYPFVLVDRILEHDPAGRLVATKNVTGAEDFFAGHFPGAAGDAGRPHPRVARPGRRHLAAQDRARPAPGRDPGGRLRRGEVPPPRRARRPAAPRGAARPPPGRSRALPRRRAGGRGTRGRGPAAAPGGDLAPGRGRPPRAGRGGRGARAGREGGAVLRRRGDGAPGSRDGARLARRDRRRHARGRAQPVLPVQLDRARAAGPEVPRRAEPGRDRRPQRVPRGDDRPPGDRRGRGAHADRVGQPAHGPGARRPRLPRREPHDPRQRGRALRPRRGARLRDARGLLGRPPVLPRRHARVHGRRHDRHARRGALLAHRRQPGPLLRAQPGRAAPPRLLRRGDRRAATGLPAFSPREASPWRRPCAASTRTGPTATRCARSSTSCAPRSAVSSSIAGTAPGPARRSPSPHAGRRPLAGAGRAARAHRRQRPLPLPRRGGRPPGGPAGRGAGHSRGGRGRARGRGGRAPLDRPRPARPGDLDPAAGGRARGDHGGAGQAPADLLGHRAGPEAAGRPRPARLPEHRQPDRRRGRRARAGRDHAPALGGLPRGPAGARGADDPPPAGPRGGEGRPSTARRWRGRSREWTSARPRS